MLHTSKMSRHKTLKRTSRAGRRSSGFGRGGPSDDRPKRRSRRTVRSRIIGGIDSAVEPRDPSMHTRTPIPNPLVLALSALALAATLALAEPAVIVRYTQGIPQIEL